MLSKYFNISNCLATLQYLILVQVKSVILVLSVNYNNECSTGSKVSKKVMFSVI